jgi:hypothetical protein
MTTRDRVRFCAALASGIVFGAVLGAAGAPPPASRPLGVAERRAAEELHAEQKQMDLSSARTTAVSPEGRQRVAETIGRQFKVSDTLVHDLRARRLGYGEVTVTLAFAQQLAKRGVARQQAIDRILELRRTGRGWGLVARELGLRVGDATADVKKTHAQLLKIDLAQLERAARPETAR